MRRRGGRWGRPRGGNGGGGRLLERVRELRALGLADVRPLERPPGLPESIELGAAGAARGRQLGVVAAARGGPELIGWAYVAAGLASAEETIGEVLIAAPVFGSSARRLAARAGERGLILRLASLPQLGVADEANELEVLPARLAELPQGAPVSTPLDRAIRVAEGAALVTDAAAVRRTPTGSYVLYVRGSLAARIAPDGDGVAVTFLQPESFVLRLDEASFPRQGPELHERVLQLAQDPRTAERSEAERDRAIDRAAADAGARVTARWIPWNADGSDALEWIGVDAAARPVLGLIRPELRLADFPALLVAQQLVLDERELWAPGSRGLPRLLFVGEQVDGRVRPLLDALELALETRGPLPLEESSSRFGGEPQRRGRRRGRRRRRGRGERGDAAEGRPPLAIGDAEAEEGAFESEGGAEAPELEDADDDREENDREENEHEDGGWRSEAAFEAPEEPHARTYSFAEEREGEPRDAGDEASGDEASGDEASGDDAPGEGEPDDAYAGPGDWSERQPSAAAQEGPAGLAPEEDAGPDEETVEDEIEATLAEGQSEEGSGEETLDAEPPARPRRARAAIVVRDDPDSILAALVLARERRGLVSFRVCGQDALMDFFKTGGTDLDANVDLLLVGFTAQPVASEVIRTAALYRGRLQWFDHHPWPIEDVERLRDAIGRDAIVFAPEAASPLAAVARVCERRSRFTDKLVDFSARRLSESEMERWGYRLAALIARLARAPGEHRSDIQAVVLGKPAELPHADGVYAEESEWLESHEPRLVYFGDYAIVVTSVPEHLDAGEIARRLRATTGARLSLVTRAGDDVAILGGNEERRHINVQGMIDHLVNRLPWVKARPGGDRAGRITIHELQRHPERLEALIGELVRHKSILYG